ncbi:MAG: glycoside hydrolase family 38 C-terminal domain-containing protein [bacterium]|nr:glycoside hydrolase family 38 C-terminal domain-containing protein [bacterium]
MLNIVSIKPTAFFKRKKDKIVQLVYITIKNTGKRINATLNVKAGSMNIKINFGLIEPKEKTYQIHIPEINKPINAEFIIFVDGKAQDKQSVKWEPQKHWEFYIVHHSHHDLGYTNLPSDTLIEYNNYIDDVLKFCEKTNKFPKESRFKYVFEQAWSVANYVKSRPKYVVSKLIKYIKEGRIEVPVFFANEITQYCSHEELVRLMYPSFKLKQKYEIPIYSGAMCDMQGLSWGIPKVLAGAGIKYFTANLQRWYSYRSDGKKVPIPYWDESKVIPANIPGIFKWEAQDGSQVIFWYDSGRLGIWSCQQLFEVISNKIELLNKQNYPFNIIRYTATGADRDNSPPTMNISRIAKEWNKKWVYPKLIMSTNHDFFNQIEKKYDKNLPVFRGEIPDTDYPIGPLSTAKETGINFITHSLLNQAEKFAAIASIVSNYTYPGKEIEDAYDNTILYDEHTWGLGQVAGPGHDGNWSEKSNYAYRASALAHNILSKSLNKITDEIKIADDGYHINIFNSLSWKRTDLVRMLFCDHTPCESSLYLKYSEDKSYYSPAGCRAIGRPIINLPIELIEKKFKIIDLETKQEVPFQIIKLKSPQDPLPYAAHRYALGEVNPAERFELIFVAENVPPMGYKTYQIMPIKDKQGFSSSICIGKTILENRFFKIKIDTDTGSIMSIYDKELQREIVDKETKHKVNQLIVRYSKTHQENYLKNVKIQEGENGPICGSVRIFGEGVGCPQVSQEILIYDNIKRIDFNNKILKDSTSFLEVYFAFPFHVENPKLKFEGANSVIEPLKDQLPGSNSDYYVMQNWAKVYNRDMSITLSSAESHVIEFGGLWPGYVSYAHHAVTPPGYGHQFKKYGEFKKGHMYSYVLSNNFQTNFQPVQVGEILSRYSITSEKNSAGDIKSRNFGWEINNPLKSVCIVGKKEGRLEKNKTFCTIDKPNVSVLTLKRAENNGNDLIVRLIETEGKKCNAKLTLPSISIREAYQSNLVEENEKEIRVGVDKHKVAVTIKPFGIITLRIRLLN